MLYRRCETRLWSRSGCAAADFVGAGSIGLANWIVHSLLMLRAIRFVESPPGKRRVREDSVGRDWIAFVLHADELPARLPRNAATGARENRSIGGAIVNCCLSHASLR